MAGSNSSSAGSSNGTTGGSTGSGPAANPAFFALRQLGNESATRYYAAALCGLIAVFIISHFSRKLARKLHINASSLGIFSAVSTVSRVSRRLLIHTFPGFPSTGHAILFVLYLAINLTLSFTGYDFSSPTNFAARFGWMAAANFAFVVFLGLKNTPLAILTSYSYERLQPLHQIAGIATVVYMILHACIYTAYFIQKGIWTPLHEDITTAGIVLGFAMLASGVEAVVLRRLDYELFYVFHIILFVAMLITLGLHRPELDADKIGIVAIICGAIWGADRLIRFVRLLYNSVNNEATVHPLPGGCTRVLLRKPLQFARAGTHCFVWLPGVRLFETHPFTIVATSPTELIISSYNGFTKSLYAYATKYPGGKLRVSTEGPYGTFPDPMDFDHVILVAGGSGATFTFGLASNMLSRMTGTQEQKRKKINFIWAVKDSDDFSWFTEHLNAIREHTHASSVALKLHATRSVRSSMSVSGNVSEKPSMRSLHRQGTAMSQKSEDKAPMIPTAGGGGAPAAAALEDEKSEQLMQRQPNPSDLEIAAAGGGPEDQGVRTVVANMGQRTVAAGVIELPVEQGRPDIAALIQEAVRGVEADKRVLIAACGPDGLIRTVRDTTATLITTQGPSVELHCEKFGW